MILNEKVKSSLFEDKKLNHCSYAIGTSFQVSDKFAIGDSETMTYYSNLWEKLESYWDNAVDKYNSNKNRVGERMMYHHMCEAQDEYRVDSFGFSCYMLRSNLTPAVNF